MKVCHHDFFGLKSEMLRVKMIILVGFIAQVNAQELESMDNLHSSDGDSMSKLAHKSIKPPLTVWPLHHVDLDRAALVRTSGGIRGASLFTRAVVPLQAATTQSAWLCKTFKALPSSPFPCPAPHFAFPYQESYTESKYNCGLSVQAHKGTDLNVNHISVLPAPAHASPPQLFQTGGFSCVDGGSKPECFSCPFFKALGFLAQGPSTSTFAPNLDDLVPPDIDGLDDSISDGGFNNQLLARTCTDVLFRIEVLTMLLIGCFVGCMITARIWFTTEEELFLLTPALFRALLENFSSKTPLCPLLLSGV